MAVGNHNSVVLRVVAADDTSRGFWRRYKDSALEAAFQKATTQSIRPVFRVLSIAELITWPAAALIDRQTAGSEANYEALLTVRWAVMPLLLGAVAHAWISDSAFTRLKNLAFSALLVVFALSPLAMGLVVPEPEKFKLFALPANAMTITAFVSGWMMFGGRLDLLCGWLVVAAGMWTAMAARLAPTEVGGWAFSGLLSIVVSVVVAILIDRSRRRAFIANRAVSRERERSDALIRNMLPDSIAARLRASPATIADHFDEATVLFADLAGFTPLTAELKPAELIDILDKSFRPSTRSPSSAAWRRSRPSAMRT
jgi:hypothetical protein